MLKRLAKEAGILLTIHKINISVCESCTGGMLGSIITSIPGSSEYFKGGVIAYSNEIKNKIVGVRASTLKKFGAVSKETAREMAKGVRKITNSDIGIAITGIAGPGGGTKDKPVGLVYIAIAGEESTKIEKCLFSGNRENIRIKACCHALNTLIKTLRGVK
jgi:PncC family amidohydrolase